MTTYSLGAVTKQDLCQLLNGDNESLLNSLKLTVKQWKHNDNVYKIVKYDKTYLTNDLIPTSGLFRSVILKDDKLCVFSPPKSLRPDQFVEKISNYSRAM